MSPTHLAKHPLLSVAPTEHFHFNGVDGATGRYLLAPMRPWELARRITRNMHRSQDCQGDARRKVPAAGVDPRRLDETGWGVIFAESCDPAVREALSELLEHRQAQANAGSRELYRELSGGDGYRAGESKVRFLARHNLGFGPTDPARLPYYLLLVGGPEEIPYEFQYQLDVPYAVGRIHFDSLKEYESYARSVLAVERDGCARSRRITCFGVENPGDVVTRLIVGDLIEPLAQGLEKRRPDWTVGLHLRDQATKANLARLLGGDETPDLLLTGSHGMGFPRGHRHQREHQGALLCRDWPGSDDWQKPIPPEHYFAAADVRGDAHLQGLVVFHFACYSAGMPRWDDFSDRPRKERRRLAPQACLARLPQRLLGHPGGGALAVVGHVERAWTWSFRWHETDVPQPQTFESTLLSIMDGYPVGAALEYFHQRYAEMASDLVEEYRCWRDGDSASSLGLARLWTAFQDARNYVLLGDPAVRLAGETLNPGFVNP